MCTFMLKYAKIYYAKTTEDQYRVCSQGECDVEMSCSRVVQSLGWECIGNGLKPWYSMYVLEQGILFTLLLSTKVLLNGNQ